MSTPPSRPDDPLTPADRAAMGEHAAPRPYPPSTGATTPGTTTPGATTPGTATPGDAPPPPPGGTPPGSTPPGSARPDDGASAGPGAGTSTTPPTTPRRTGGAHAAHDEDLPEAPSRPGVVRHVLGVLLGLVLTPVALLLTAIGTARLAEVAGTADMGTDTLGIAMLAVGLVLLAVVVLLGAWTPALPITGGLVWGVGLGTAYLVVPGVMEDLVENAFGRTPAAAEELAESAMSGHLAVVGVLLLAAGLATAVARRRGRRWAEQVAAAEAARTRAAEPGHER